MKSSSIRWMVLWAATIACPGALIAQDGPLKVETLDEAAPDSVAQPIRDVLESKAYRVLDGQGEPFVDIWVREGVPVTGKPAGPEGAVLFPIVEVGQLVGIVRFNKEGYDYRDQPITPDLYTLRY